MPDSPNHPPDPPPRPPFAGLGAASTASPRFTSHARRQRERYGSRLFRVSLPITAEYGAPGAARDHLVREMVRLNHHHGAAKFQAVLEEAAAAFETGLTIDLARAALAPAPVVGLALATSTRFVTDGLLEALRTVVEVHDATLELPLPDPGTGPEPAEEFARAAALAREMAFPVTAVRFVGSPGDGPVARRDDARFLNRLRVRAVKIHPAAGRGDTGLGSPETATAAAYVAAVANLIEQLDPAIQIQGLGSAGGPHRGAEPAWMEAGEDLHAQLEQALETGGGCQGCRHTG